MPTTATAPARRVRRPMTELTGTMADLLPTDYVDEIGGVSPTTGINYRKHTVGRLIHRLAHHEETYSDRIAAAARTLGAGSRKAERLATRPEHVSVEFLGLGSFSFHVDVPVRFRRFAD